MMISKFTERLPFTQEQNRFLLVGFTAVFIDFLVYSGLQGLAPVSISTAKAGGFVAGAAFSYAVNGRYTFRQARLGMASLSRFIVLYLQHWPSMLSSMTFVWPCPDTAQSGFLRPFWQQPEPRPS